MRPVQSRHVGAHPLWSATCMPGPRRQRALADRSSESWRRRRWLVVALLVLGLLGAFGLSWKLGLWRPAPSATLRIRTPGGEPSAGVEVTFFPAGFGYSQPSPPPALGQRTLNGPELVLREADFGPDVGRVRYEAPGFGIGFASFAFGAAATEIVLRPAQTLRGRVGEPLWTWMQGWRCTGFTPVAGAEVVLMGGGEHGLALVHGVTGADGSFVLDGVDGQLDGLALRVRAPGFAIAHREVPRFSTGASDEPIVAVVRGAAFDGELRTPPGLSPTSLRVLARGLPGVEAVPAEDGSFTLHHVPVGIGVRLHVHGLPRTTAQLPAMAKVGERTTVTIVPAGVVRGQVVDGVARRSIAGALVFCGSGEAVRADADGRFELAHVMPGAQELRAQHDFLDGRRRKHQQTGHTPVSVLGGQVLEGIVVDVSAK